MRLWAKIVEHSAVIINEFLASNAFRSAAMVSIAKMVKKFMYNQLKSLEEIYPFTPDQIGYKPMKGDRAIPKTLLGY